MTLSDLLASVPGVTLMTTGFLLAPQVAAYYGDPGRVRLYLDGVELDALNPRNGGIPDLAMVPLWALEDVKVERAAERAARAPPTLARRSHHARTRAPTS